MVLPASGAIAATGIRAGEGPVWLSDGRLLVCEMAGAGIALIAPDGAVERRYSTGGTPNGAALGPDGHLYICNRGQTHWVEQHGMLLPVHDQSDAHGGGSIQRLDLASGAVEKVYTHCDERELNGPNDIVFDAEGGFYFTDFGHMRRRDKDRGFVYHALPDGSAVREVGGPLDGPNGIGLAPDGRTLYVAETFSNFLWAFPVEAPGRLGRDPGSMAPHGARFVAQAPGFGYIDSFAVDGEGHVIMARPLAGDLVVVSPDGAADRIPVPDPAPTNLCFGGPELTTVFVTLAATQRVLALPWPRPGLPLHFSR